MRASLGYRPDGEKGNCFMAVEGKRGRGGVGGGREEGSGVCVYMHTNVGERRFEMDER